MLKTLLRMKKAPSGAMMGQEGPPPDGIRVFWEEVGSDWGADGHNRPKGRIARCHFSDWKSDIFDVFTMRTKNYMKSVDAPCSPMVTFTKAGITFF